MTAAADFSGSTNAMIRYVEQTQAPRYLLLTECSMGENVAAANPDKEMLRLCSVRCPHMAQITLEDTRDALKYNRYVIEVPEDVRVRALRAVERLRPNRFAVFVVGDFRDPRTGSHCKSTEPS